jgi:hypothetical protein
VAAKSPAFALSRSWRHSARRSSSDASTPGRATGAWRDGDGAAGDGAGGHARGAITTRHRYTSALADTHGAGRTGPDGLYYGPPYPSADDLLVWLEERRTLGHSSVRREESRYFLRFPEADDA